MTLLSVKVFDNSNTELNSTTSVSNDQRFYDLIPILGRLARDERQRGRALGLITNERLFAYCSTINDLLLVATATLNTSFQRLELFLALLCEFLTREFPYPKSIVSTNDFQEICNSIVETIDDSLVELKIALLGLDRSGKTTFINFFRENQLLTGFETYKPTQILNVIRIENISGLPQIQFYDLGYAFQHQWWRFNSESDGYIFFVDSSDTNRIKKSVELFQEIRNFWDQPFVIAANMRDTSRIVNIRKYLARKFHLSSKKIYETNTWTGAGILPLLEGLVKHEIKGEDITVSLVHPNRNRK